MREVIITQSLYGFDQKNRLFSMGDLGWNSLIKNQARYGPEILQLCGKAIKTKGGKCFTYGGIDEEELCCWVCMFPNAQY